MSSMKNTKEGINLKKLLRLKNTGSIFVIVGLLIILVIASYTYILQSSYTKTALETEIARDTASADAVHKLVDGKIGKEDFNQIKDQSDETKQVYKDISSYFNEIRTLNSTRYIYTAAKNEEGKLVYVVDGLDPEADDVRHPGDYIEEEMVPYIPVFNTYRIKKVAQALISRVLSHFSALYLFCVDYFVDLIIVRKN